MIGVLVMFLSLRRIQKLTLVVNFSLMKWMLKASLPFLFTGAFIVIYGQMDTILISMFVDESGVGLIQRNRPPDWNTCSLSLQSLSHPPVLPCVGCSYQNPRHLSSCCAEVLT
jgi:hypothetical protein